MIHRQRLASRRTHETVAVEMLEQRFKVGIGRETDIRDVGDVLQVTVGPPAEVFINAQKPNSALDVLCSDSAILMSLLIQYGCPIENIRHSMKRDPDGKPSSPLGFAADLLNETMETSHADSSPA